MIFPILAGVFGNRCHLFRRRDILLGLESIEVSEGIDDLYYILYGILYKLIFDMILGIFLIYFITHNLIYE